MPVTPEYKKQLQRDRNYKRRYGKSHSEVHQMWLSQGMKCSCCTQPIDAPGTSKATHLDHCHSSLRVRGLLCASCNLTLGHIKDSPERCLQLYRYLNKHANSTRLT